MSVIKQTNELPRGWYRGYQLGSEAEAVQFAAGRVCYLYHSIVIETMWILFVPAESVG